MNQPLNRLARRFRSLVFVAVVLGTAAACARAVAAAPPVLDPVHTDGDKYQTVFENSLVRVLRYRDEPGATTHLHHHPCFVMYVLGSFARELTFPDGSQRSRKFQAGEVAWMPAQSHAGHNSGDTPTDALLFEVKGPCK